MIENDRFNSRKIFIVALRVAYMNLMWPFSVIGIPMIIWGLDDNILEKISFFLIMNVIIFVPYIVICFLKHKISMSNEIEKENFGKLSDYEKGKQIGNELSGYW